MYPLAELVRSSYDRHLRKSDVVADPHVLRLVVDETLR
jgi:hypothetical protein